MQHKTGGSAQKERNRRLEQEAVDRGKLEQEVADDRELNRRAQRATVLSGWATTIALLMSALSLLHTTWEANKRQASESDAAAGQLFRSYLKSLSDHPEVFSLDIEKTDVPAVIV